jgi:putative DNA primase/helicase
MASVDNDRAVIAEAIRQSRKINGHKKPNGQENGETGAIAPEFSEDQVALDFTARHCEDLRYVAQWGKWLRWNGTRWEIEKTLMAFDLARDVVRDYANACQDEREAKKLASAKTVNAVQTLARADRHHAAVTEQWDTDLLALNTPGGTVDLRTGTLRPHRRVDYITKITSVAPGGDCPLWLAFLERIMNSDQTLVDYLQRVSGYALTGITREHALFFGYGTGGNGKGVFLGTLGGILQDYAAVAPMEVFLFSHTDKHPTDLAGLRGARLVTAQETEEGRRWAETKIKTLSGGDPIPARFMRQDFFTYVPQFKLFIAGNHKPGLRGVDEAIRRRFNLIPFTVTIPKDERDKELAAKLKGEWPGILQWMIEGCSKWLREGLNPPSVVRQATENYLAAEDTLARWIEEECAVDPSYFGTIAALFASWKTWTEAAGEFTGSKKRLSQQLTDRGFRSDQTGPARDRGFFGIALRP